MTKKKKLPVDIICFCKGMCEPNPGGLMSYAYVLYLAGEQEPFYSNSGRKIDNIESTNYRAYYHAILQTFRELIEQGLTDKVIEIRTDLKGALGQITDWILLEYDPADYSLMYNQSDLLKEITDIRHRFKKVRFIWVDKNENKVAGKLANDALTFFVGGKSE